MIASLRNLDLVVARAISADKSGSNMCPKADSNIASVVSREFRISWAAQDKRNVSFAAVMLVN